MIVDHQVARMNEAGIPLIMIPMEADFGRKSVEERDAEIIAAQSAAKAKGMLGTVVFMWPNGDGWLYSALDIPRQTYEGIPFSVVVTNIRDTLSW